MEIVKIKQNFFESYCKEKGYQVNFKEISYGVKLEISNVIEKVGIVFYSSGKIVPEGNPNSALRKELEELKLNIEQNPDILNVLPLFETKACSQKYEIIVSDLQNSIKEALNSLNYNIEIQANINTNEIFRAKIHHNALGLTIIQYKTGTLLIQGKQDKLFDEVCSLIEKIAKPTGKEVVIRFLADNKDALDNLNATFNPEILNKAEESIKIIIGNDAFNFLDEHDKKYLVASECLRLCNIPLPEFSPIVMPASKAFEGFTKKLVISLGILDSNHFANKNANFSIVKDRNQPRTKSVIDKDRYAETHLNKLILSLDMFRNFMLHSDDSTVTKVNTFAEAEGKLNDLLKDLKEIYHYFKSNTVFGI